MRKRSHPKKAVQKSQQNTARWNISRRGFILSASLGAAATQIPLGKSFAQSVTQKSILSEKQQAIVSSVQEILFPKDENGPGATEIHALEYLNWVLSDPEKDQEEVDYLIKGIGWVDETAEEETGKEYQDLTQSEREQLIEKISQESWGESWLSVNLSIIFEALLSDPQYGGNPDEKGWKWLSHNPGQPRPTKDILYPIILNYKNKPD